MVYHFKQTIVVKREQEIPNYTVQRTMIRKTTLAHEVQGAYELPQHSLHGKLGNIKIKHTQSPCSFSFPHSIHPIPNSVLPTRARVLWTLPREKPSDLKGEGCNICSSSDTLEISGLRELVQACHSFHNI